jgi:hypothetical protein
MWKIIAMLFVPVLAHAELSATTQYLTSERATLLDIGLMRLETLTSEFERRVGVHWTDKGTARFFRPEINTLYELNDDKFYVYFSVMESRPTDEQMAEGCENAMTQMNIWLRKALPQLFLHTGYNDPSVPAELPQALLEMFELRCYFSSERDSSEGRFWASRSLGDTQMKIGKWKIREQ